MIISPELLRAYKYIRHDNVLARYALEGARVALVHHIKGCYSNEWHWQRGAGNVSRQQKERLGDNYAWIENTKSAGLRFVGYADEITRLDHNGWYVDEDQDSTYRGAVWQLPARKGVARYIAGYVDPNNKGAAFVSLDVISEKGGWSRLPGRVGSSWWPQEHANDEAKHDAAQQADEIARIYAEKERDYTAVANARFRYDEIPEQIATERNAIRELITELRAARKAITSELPRSCALLRAHIRKGLDAIQKLRDERERLAAEWSGADGWEG